ncbi:GNAT family N-acetyltransferase [Nocardia sp. NPDC003963]
MPHHRGLASDRCRPVPCVRIVHLNRAVFEALAEGDRAAANTASPVPLTVHFAGPDRRRLWQMRSEQVRREPAGAGWVTGVIWDEQEQLAVGRAGFHGLPDGSGMVEIGYAVDPGYRRRGYARGAGVFVAARCSRAEGRNRSGQHQPRQPGVVSVGIVVRLRRGRAAMGRRGRARDHL